MDMESIQRVLTGDSVVEKMEALKRKYEFLESKKDDIEDELQYEEATSSRKRPRREVQTWISNVLEKKDKVQELDRDVSNLTCVDRLLNTTQSKIESLTREVDELTEQSRFERGLTLESYDRERVSMLTKRLIGRVFEENKGRILGSVLAGNGSVIGVYGMGGVGKTTLLQHIHNELLGQPDVHVYWVTVSQNATYKKLLDDIAKRVNVDISEADEEKMIRAAKVKGALDMRQNFVFILDDVWEPISLEDFGISVGSGGRVVLTTRSLEVCRRMGCRNSIKVEPLDPEEGWTLFRETLGGEDTIMLSDEIEEVAKCLAKECCGLPLGIITLATSMRGVEDPSEWRDSLEKVREHESSDSDSVGFDRVLSILELSYHRLKDLKLQRCFLYCSLFPEDELIERDELITFLIDEGLIDRMRSTKSEFDRGHRILNKLENVCLLEAQKNPKEKMCVKMHDLVRDMAIRIAHQSPHRHMVEARMGLRDMPSNEKWPEDIKRVSLMYNNICAIASNSTPNCPSLSTLFLRCNFGLSAIPDNFFQLMKALTILDLSKTIIKSLPGSVSDLGSLTVLLLAGCKELRNVPSLENVTALRRLDLSETAIVELPKGMERLNNLRYLNLNRCKNLQALPLGVFPELHRMEWFESDHVINLTGEEVSSWTNLDTFHGNFCDVGELKACTASWEGREPSKYTIFVGYDNRKYNIHHLYYESVPQKHVHVFGNIDMEDANILPSGTRGLVLQGCGGITSLNHIASLRKATSIEQLSLWVMKTLNDLSLPTNLYSSLKRLNIRWCARMKFLFTPPMLATLRCLESLSIKYCTDVEEILGGTTDDESTIVSFPPKLVKLELGFVPILKSFCTCSIKVSDSLQEIWIYGCRNLMRITLLCHEAPSSLKKVVVQKLWWEAWEWKHPHTKSVLQPFVTYIDSDELYRDRYPQRFIPFFWIQ